jgi:hypothetical protein
MGNNPNVSEQTQQPNGAQNQTRTNGFQATVTSVVSADFRTHLYQIVAERPTAVTMIGEKSPSLTMSAVSNTF